MAPNTDKSSKLIKLLIIIATNIICLATAIVLLFQFVFTPNNKYTTALSLMATDQYEEARLIFEELDGYKDSSAKVTECSYLSARALMDAGNYTDAIAVFAQLRDYKDSTDMILACETSIADGQYEAALALLEAQDYGKALEAFSAMNGYKDSALMIEACYKGSFAQGLKDIKVGETFNFGLFEQDGNLDNGKEKIEWQVLAKEDSKILVVSKYALDCRKYHEEYATVVWENCTLRQWLNKDFLEDSFESWEREMIPTVKVSADRNPKYRTYSGRATEDQVFLLSIAEAYRHFPLKSMRLCIPTKYAISKGAWVSDNGYCYWWLRSPGDTQYDAAGVFGGVGGVHEAGNDVDNNENAVRPAMWIDLDP